MLAEQVRYRSFEQSRKGVENNAKKGPIFDVFSVVSLGRHECNEFMTVRVVVDGSAGDSRV